MNCNNKNNNCMPNFNSCYVPPCNTWPDLLVGPTGPTGPIGPTGLTPIFRIGTVTTGAPGSNAEVIITPV